MKKIIFFLLISILTSIFLVGCKDKENAETPEKSEPTPFVVNTHGSIEGLQNMELFYEKVQDRVQSEIRVTHYTTEGDPIWTDLVYDGETIKGTYDTSKDKFGSGNIEKFTCKNFIRVEDTTYLSYRVTECEGIDIGMSEILNVNYNMKEQDFFEFQLKYGEKLENEINTIDKKFTKAKNIDEMVTVSDFDLPFEVKQEVYKKLVFANYLAEKPLKDSCEKNDIKYNLNVHINSANRKFSWSDCDTSVEGKQMTEIVQYIINASEK